jgi:hypothetical protein
MCWRLVDNIGGRECSSIALAVKQASASWSTAKVLGWRVGGTMLSRSCPCQQAIAAVNGLGIRPLNLVATPLRAAPATAPASTTSMPVSSLDPPQNDG